VAAWLAKPENLEALRPAPIADAGAALRGTPCSPGFAEGLAKVVREANEFDGGILVTYRTDPGWVPVFASAQALLIERGSPLTHAAIVAREIGIPTIVQIPPHQAREYGMCLVTGTAVDRAGGSAQHMPL
jgi:pyruvate,water dikinase